MENLPERYRESARPAATVIRLESLDMAKVWRTLLVFVGCVAVDIVVVVLVSGHPMLVALTAVLPAFGTLSMLLIGLQRATSLRYLLEVDLAEIRLLAPNGERLARTSDATLRFEKMNYVRKARNQSYVRPGYRVSFPGGTTVIGTLYPDLPWDDKPTVDGIPDHELKPPQLEALAETLQLPR